MKLDLYNISEFVKANHWLPVTNPISLYADGTPTEDGLYSEVIFGKTTEDQMNRFAYIDFGNHHFIHPAIYSIIRGRMKGFDNIITGTKNGKIVNGKLVVVDDNDPDGESGLDWFYEVFDKINWITESEMITTDSIDKKTRLKLFKELPKNIFFVNKWLVLPRGYRDYNINDNSDGDEINKVYKKLIQLSKSLHSTFGFDLADNNIKFEIQKQLCILYDITLKLITGKNVDINTGEKLGGNAKFAMFRKNLIGTHVDFGMSSIITAPNISLAERWNETPAPFGYIQVPLQSAVSMLFPFFINECATLLENLVEYKFIDIPGITIDQNQFSSSNIQLMLKRFTKSASDRHEPILIYVISDTGEKYSVRVPIYERDDNTKNIRKRYFTAMDLIYMAAINICKDKKVLVTRYPVTNNQNISIFKMNVGSSVKTHPVSISFDKDMLQNDAIGTDIKLASFELNSYEKYPYIPTDPKNPDIPKIWSDIIRVLICGNGSLASFGGDYDGDMLYCRCLFSNEANAEAERIINDKANYFNANGDLTRSITGIAKDCTLGLYELTKNG